jgi:hypothetical protein
MLEQEANSGEFIMKRFFVLAGLIYLQTGDLSAWCIKWSSEAKREECEREFERDFAKRQEERIAKYNVACQKLETQVIDCINKNNYRGTFVLSVPEETRIIKEFEPYKKVIKLAELDNDLSDAEIKNMENTFDSYFDKIYPDISGVMEIDFINLSGKWHTLWNRQSSISHACS